MYKDKSIKLIMEYSSNLKLFNLKGNTIEQQVDGVREQLKKYLKSFTSSTRLIFFLVLLFSTIFMIPTAYSVSLYFGIILTINALAMIYFIAAYYTILLYSIRMNFEYAITKITESYVEIAEISTIENVDDLSEDAKDNYKFFKKEIRKQVNDAMLKFINKDCND